MKRSSARSDTPRRTAEPRRGEDDSPPRQRIDSVQKGASGAATIAVGGSSFCVLPSQAEELGLAASSLLPGAELDDEALGLLALAAEAREAEARGLALLARAEQSAFMLRVKLEGRGFSRRAVGLALARLSADSLLDDRRYAAAYAASRLARRGSRAEGPASLSAALAGRGVDRSVAAEAIAAALGPEERAAALADAARKELARSGGDRNEARSRLRALGYKSEEITDCLEEGEG